MSLARLIAIMSDNKVPFENRLAAALAAASTTDARTRGTRCAECSQTECGPSCPSNR